jgi:hypothetical protein
MLNDIHREREYDRRDVERELKGVLGRHESFPLTEFTAEA